MKSIHILLIEDNEGDVVLTTEALSDGRITNTISVAKDGWEAIQYLEKQGIYIDAVKPDIILLDINLPKMNGHEVLKRIKSNNAINNIPVVIITSSSSEKDISESYRNYAHSFITKPIDIGAFLKVVASIKNMGINIVQLSGKNNI